MITRLNLLSTLCFCFTTSINAQINAYFGQPYCNPMAVNAALTGSMNHQNRLTIHYKKWDTFFKENFFAVAYEHRFDLKTGDYLAFGTHIGQSDMGILEQKQGKMAVAYSKYLGGNGQSNTHYLMAGAEIGFQNSTLDLNRHPLWAFNNYTTGNGAGFPVFKIDSFYVSTGALWCATWKNGRSAHLGIALHRIFTPLETVSYNFNLPLLWRYTFHGGMEIPFLRRQMRIAPNLIFMKQGENTDIISSLALKIVKNEAMALKFGVFTRHFINHLDREKNKNVVGLFGCFDFQAYSANVSYEMTLPNSVEFAIICRFGDLKEERFKLPIW